MAALPSEIIFLASSPTAAPLSVRLCRTWQELEPFLGDWNALLGLRSTASVFQTPEWLSSWWQAYGAKKDLRTLIFSDAERNVVGIAPMYAEPASALGLPIKVLRMVGAGSGDSDALDFITAPGYEQFCAETFLTWLKDESQCGLCALDTLPQDSLVAQHIAAAAGDRGLQLYSETLPNFFIELPSTWQEYLGGLQSSFRPLLTRYPKRLQSRYRVRIARCEREEDIEANLQALFALHQMRWTGQGEPGAFSSAERRDFYFRMSRSFLHRGWLEFWLLTLEDEIVAAQFCFRYGNTVYLLQEGFHPKYAAEKIGYALRAHVLEEMIKAGVTRYDFLGGADAYKSKYGSRQGSYLTLRVGLSPRGRMHLALQQRKLQIKQWLKTNLPAPVLAVLRREKPQAAAGSRKNEAME
ncbi:MAG TPA: GNAT family N-acetyltransferase [Candidatus Angelobacter sp.]|nr:GNAT family N-acetyltransferase [Candidatus Angelobacter sp.]